MKNADFIEDYYRSVELWNEFVLLERYGAASLQVIAFVIVIVIVVVIVMVQAGQRRVAGKTAFESDRKSLTMQSERVAAVKPSTQRRE